jgi:hypothetical protein
MTVSQQAKLLKSLFTIKFQIMKAKFRFIFILLSCSSTFQSMAQLIVNGTSQNYFGQLDNTAFLNDNWIRSIGIGYFDSGFPNSFLHINSNIGLLPQNGSIANYGEVFRTDAPADVTTAWRMFSGNVSANEKFNIRNTSGTNHVVFGTVQSGHLDFQTGNTFRGRLTSDGALYFSGTSGANPNLGAGTRLMWVPSQAAFRVGEAYGNDWNSGFVGSHSVAMGSGVWAQGDFSFTVGLENNVEGESSGAIGSLNFTHSNAVGGFAAGSQNNVLAPFAMALGGHNDAADGGSIALGLMCESGGIASIAGGFQAVSSGDYSVALGYQAHADYDHAFALGQGALASYENGVAIGKFAWSDAEDCFALGDVHNDIPESLKLGFTGLGDVLFAGPGASGGPVSGVGIGGVDDPTERLDVNGNARFREIPSETPNVLITGAEEDAEGDYSLSYLEFSGDGDEYLGGDGAWHTIPTPPAEQCDWNVNSQDIIMGYPGSSPIAACRGGNVGVGTHLPRARLDLISANTVDKGINVNSSSDAHAQLFAIDSRALFARTNQDIYAVRANASNNTSCGVSYSTTQAYGVHAYANNGNKNFAVYAAAIPHVKPAGWTADTCASYISSWAGYFNGATFSPGGVWHVSDENLKTDIQPIQNSSEILDQLNPAIYQFNHTAYPGIHLPLGSHWGLMAQELEELMPSAVANVVHPAQYDDEGNQTSQEHEFKAVNFIELIPILIAGHKEQQATIEAQQEAIDAQQAQIQELAALVAVCCEAGGAKSMNQPQGPQDEGMHYDLKIEQPYLGQNVPNPFMVETSITYRIPEQAMVRVRVMDAKGQQVDMLVDGLMPKGEYKIVWNASHLPSGLYFYTLEADGVELVKKAVKL